MLLNIFHTGGITLALTIFFIGLATMLTWQGVGKMRVEKKWNMHLTMAVILIGLYLAALVFIVGPEYKGV